MRTSAAEAIKHRPFTARLNPCPSYRDALSLSFLVVARGSSWYRSVVAAKSRHAQAIYGIAEAVPFIQRRFFIQLSDIAQLMTAVRQRSPKVHAALAV